MRIVPRGNVAGRLTTEISLDKGGTTMIWQRIHPTLICHPTTLPSIERKGLKIRRRDGRTFIPSGDQARPLAILPAVDFALKSETLFRLQAEVRMEEKNVSITRGGQLLHLGLERGTREEVAENHDCQPGHYHP